MFTFDFVQFMTKRGRKKETQNIRLQGGEGNKSRIRKRESKDVRGRARVDTSSQFITHAYHRDALVAVFVCKKKHPSSSRVLHASHKV